MVLKKYREAKQEIWHDIFCARHKERLKERQSEQRTKNVIEFKRSPERKLEIATAKLIEWQRAVKKAQNKVKVYNRKVKYYELRMAAMKG
jgi:ribosomal protein L13